MSKRMPAPALKYTSLMLAGMLLLSARGWGQAAAEPAIPLEQWKSAVIAGDAAALTALYSVTPPMQASTVDAPLDATAETNFWIRLKAHSMKLDVVGKTSPQPGVQVITFQAEVQRPQETVYVTESQLWQQQLGQWRLVASKRTDAMHLKQPLNANKNIYPPDADAHAELKEAEAKASREHKRILLVFGANWCYDCHVLDLAFQRPDFTSALSGYEIVHIDIGEDGKKNSDLSAQFQVPIEKGVPALAVVESDGKLVVSQKNGEFEKTRALTPEAVLAFLNKWKASS